MNLYRSSSDRDRSDKPQSSVRNRDAKHQTSFSFQMNSLITIDFD